MSWEQRNVDFCNAQTDAQMAYIEAEREVDRLQAENAKLRELVGTLRGYLAGDTGPCDCCAMQGTCENHPAPPPCKYELDGEHAPVLGWIDDNLSELGVEL